MKLFHCVLILYVVVIFSLFDHVSTTRHPILLIPGYMGSLLEGSFLRKSVAWPMLCPTYSSGKVMWFNVPNFFPFAQDCWLENFRLHYNSTSRKSYSDPGVRIYVRDFGGGRSVDFFSPSLQQNSETMYYYNMIESFVNRLGYVRGIDVHGVPYDWRKAINENEEFSQNFKSLIEDAFDQNNEAPVIIICHSMGCQFAYTFFSNQSPTWNRRYIKSWMILTSPLGGTFKYLYDSFGSDDYPANMFPIVRFAERTFSAKQFLLPRPSVYGDDALVQTDTKTYTASDYEALYTALNQSSQYQQWLDTKDLYDTNFPNPGIANIFCLVGIGQPTMERAIIDGELNPNLVRVKNVVYGDGDTFVNIKSGRRCQLFNRSDTNFVYRELNIDHMSAIKRPEGISLVTEYIKMINNDGH